MTRAGDCSETFFHTPTFRNRVCGMWQGISTPKQIAPHRSPFPCPPPLTHLEDSVLILLAGDVPGGVAPGDVETLPLNVYPMETWVMAAVHLGNQPGLQANAAGVGAHGDINDCRNLTCKKRGKAVRKPEAWLQSRQHSPAGLQHRSCTVLPAQPKICPL